MSADSWRVSDLIAQLERDPWRDDNPFSEEIEQCHEVLFDPATSRGDKAQAILKWLGESQPCLFGRMEARQQRLHLCILTENDLERSDRDIRATIQTERTEWRRQALKGDSHGFLIVAVSRAIARARRGTVLQELACQLCALYIDAWTTDEIHLDDVILEIEMDGERRWRTWRVGVNFFSAQGDQLWWHDHRFPGGMAFSMNSVGHMARTKAQIALKRNAALIPADAPRDKLVYWALPTAMKTIGPPQRNSQRGTCLAEHGTFEEDNESIAFDKRERNFREFEGFSENRYIGKYHTDHTIPSAYFDEALWRDEDLVRRDNLYFTYLHRLTDEDYEGMGIGLEAHLGHDFEELTGSDE